MRCIYSIDSLDIFEISLRRSIRYLPKYLPVICGDAVFFEGVRCLLSVFWATPQREKCPTFTKLLSLLSTNLLLDLRLFKRPCVRCAELDHKTKILRIPDAKGSQKVTCGNKRRMRLLSEVGFDSNLLLAAERKVAQKQASFSSFRFLGKALLEICQVFTSLSWIFMRQ